jgi:hypothetical protein
MQKYKTEMNFDTTNLIPHFPIFYQTSFDGGFVIDNGSGIVAVVGKEWFVDL